jgi:hypothetical protein
MSPGVAISGRCRPYSDSTGGGPIHVLERVIGHVSRLASVSGDFSTFERRRPFSVLTSSPLAISFCYSFGSAGLGNQVTDGQHATVPV